MRGALELINLSVHALDPVNRNKSDTDLGTQVYAYRYTAQSCPITLLSLDVASQAMDDKGCRELQNAARLSVVTSAGRTDSYAVYIVSLERVLLCCESP